MRLSPFLAIALFPATAALADARERPAVHDFGPSLATPECSFPEGIAVDPHVNLYASAFSETDPANICVVSARGRLVDVIPVAAGPAGVAGLLGELFDPRRGLYVTDFADGAAGNGRLLRVDPASHDVEVVATGFTAPNAIAEDRRGNLFVSDSFAGTVSKVAADGSSNVVWKQDVLFTTTGQPPFGANGLAFDREQRFLYVANTGDSRILRVPVLRDGSAGEVEIFADGAAIDAAQDATGALHGADGIQFDARGNLWVCANQANEIQVLSPRGELVARFAGEGADALDFPASLVFRGHELLLTNLSLNDGGVNSKLSRLRAPAPGLLLVR